MTDDIDALDLNAFHPNDFMELYVCALLIMSEDGDATVRDAHSGVETLREQLDFELASVPPRKELH
jgi:hypothetical protein